MNEHFYFNINLDIGTPVQVVNEYTLIIVENVIFTVHYYSVHQKYQPFLNPLMTISGF